jgi:hypothetical protein
VADLESIAKPAASVRRFSTDSSDAIRTLVAQWNNVATELRHRGADSGLARAYELCAQELETALADQDSRLLSVKEAAALTGRNRDTIHKAIVTEA